MVTDPSRVELGWDPAVLGTSTRRGGGLFPGYGRSVARASRATAALAAAGVVHRVHAYTHDGRSTDHGREAVDALGVDDQRVLKTLVIEVDGVLAVAVLPVPHQLDLKAAAAALGGRRGRMADRRAAERSTGYVLGGVSPLGQRSTLPTVVHDEVLQHDTVLCSAGQRGLELELDPAELVRLTGAVTAPITRG